jgi:hypothetical protein
MKFSSQDRVCSITLAFTADVITFVTQNISFRNIKNPCPVELEPRHVFPNATFADITVSETSECSLMARSLTAVTHSKGDELLSHFRITEVDKEL